jgi:hypothetical protein
MTHSTMGNIFHTILQQLTFRLNSTSRKARTRLVTIKTIRRSIFRIRISEIKFLNYWHVGAEEGM